MLARSGVPQGTRLIPSIASHSQATFFSSQQSPDPVDALLLTMFLSVSHEMPNAPKCRQGIRGGHTQPPMDRANVPVRTGLTAWRQAADNLRSRKFGAGHGEVFGFTGAAGRSQLAVMVRGQRVG